ncbi:RICIN domain-containing protein [Tenggerimyces flavus]|uniref:RICIN domain-containing protein n=1 Tax=Tenggerimyces flavus TaxID=1708749 RepID=A0ABV7Y1W0_9ACTN|nr:RICIN domain-containing protein [Tenggerimyces flavus]MBM7790909.1 hypothetical protein [Tenggerimyces flavus]
MPDVDGSFLISDPDTRRFATAETQTVDPLVSMLDRGLPAQTWGITSDPRGNHEIRNTSTNTCWAVPRITVGPGSLVKHVACTGASEQQWEIQTMSTDGTTRLISVHSARCAGLALTEPGNKPVLRELDCTGGANQKFLLLRLT